MMNEDNKKFTREVKQDLLAIITRINSQIQETDSFTYDTDCDMMRTVRDQVIRSVDTISHFEYKELL